MVIGCGLYRLFVSCIGCGLGFFLFSTVAYLLALLCSPLSPHLPLSDAAAARELESTTLSGDILEINAPSSGDVVKLQQKTTSVSKRAGVQRTCAALILVRASFYPEL